MSRKRRRTCGPPVTSSTSEGEKTTAPSLPRAAEMRRVSLPSTDTFFFLRLLSKPAETVAGPSPVHDALQVERVLRERGQLAVARAAEGAEALQVVDRFQEIRLPLGVVADHRHPFGREAQLLDPQVAEVAQLQFSQDHEAKRDREREIPDMM